MPFRYIPPTFDQGEEILAMPHVRKELHKEAERRLEMARRIAVQEGLPDFADALIVEDGIRPKGRPFSQVVADIETGEAIEFGDNNTVRRRILGRVQGGPPGGG